VNYSNAICGSPARPNPSKGAPLRGRTVSWRSSSIAVEAFDSWLDASVTVKTVFVPTVKTVFVRVRSSPLVFQHGPKRTRAVCPWSEPPRPRVTAGPTARRHMGTEASTHRSRACAGAPRRVRTPWICSRSSCSRTPVRETTAGGRARRRAPRTACRLWVGLKYHTRLPP